MFFFARTVAMRRGNLKIRFSLFLQVFVSSFSSFLHFFVSSDLLASSFVCFLVFLLFYPVFFLHFFVSLFPPFLLSSFFISSFLLVSSSLRFAVCFFVSSSLRLFVSSSLRFFVSFFPHFLYFFGSSCPPFLAT